MPSKRIAVLGLILESNAFAPATRLADFEQYMLHRGEGLLDLARQFGFDDVGGGAFDVEIAPILVAGAESGGPFVHDDYLALVGEIEESLRRAGPLDGVFIFGHGAGLTTELDDMDGDYFARVRKIVGPHTPIVAELDLHANLSDLMVEACDILVGYRTNPHVDILERAQESVSHLLQMIEGRKPTVAYQRLPLVTAQIAQLTTPDAPYGKLMKIAEEAMEREDVANVTLLSGFSFADTPYNGFAVCVTTWNDEDLALRLCDDIAAKAWAMRQDFIKRPMTIEEAAAHELEALERGAEAPRIYADIADNPGGGARGNTIHLLRAFAEAGARGVIAGAYYDPSLVEAAAGHGTGADFEAHFNTEETSEYSGTWTMSATVERIFEGDFTPRLGVQVGEPVRLGRCAVLSLGDGVQVLVCSLRNQLLSPEYFTFAGLEVGKAQSIIVKSRGHFRAGFADVAPPSRIYEVDGPGLTTADISQISWKALPRPSFPIDAVEEWTPSATVKAA
ncbi:MAG: M81 family metallopeptidase [Pseudomonadota bacterium]